MKGTLFWRPLEFSWRDVSSWHMLIGGLQNGDSHFYIAYGVTFRYPLTPWNRESSNTNGGALKQGVMPFVYAGTPWNKEYQYKHRPWFRASAYWTYWPFVNLRKLNLMGVKCSYTYEDEHFWCKSKDISFVFDATRTRRWPESVFHRPSYIQKLRPDTMFSRVRSLCYYYLKYPIIKYHLLFQNPHCVEYSNQSNTDITEHSFPHTCNTECTEYKEYTLNRECKHDVLNDNTLGSLCNLNGFN